MKWGNVILKLFTSTSAPTDWTSAYRARIFVGVGPDEPAATADATNQCLAAGFKNARPVELRSVLKGADWRDADWRDADWRDADWRDANFVQGHDTLSVVLGDN